MRPAATLTFVALAALPLAPMLGCGDSACSPCPPGSRASDPSKLCSTCVAAGDGSAPDAPDAAASDADANGDSADEGIPCDHPNDLNCVDELGHQGSLVICGDFGAAPVCVAGRLACPPNTIEFNQCTCSGPPSPCAVCTAAGWRCDADASADADSPADTSAGCSFSATYLAYDDGGNRPSVEKTLLTPPRTDTTEQVSTPIDDGSACDREVACLSASAVTVPQIEAAVANADVQAALAQPDGTLYGSDPRPVDGTVWVFKRNGRGFAVGPGPVPAGLTALETLLRQLTTETHSSSECAAN
jgi:hypothetical protein